MGDDSGVLEGFFKDFLEGNFRHCRTRFVVVGRVQIASTKKSVEGAEGSGKAGVESIGHMTAKKFLVWSAHSNRLPTNSHCRPALDFGSGPMAPYTRGYGGDGLPQV